VTGARSTRVARAFRRTALPLASYYAVTLALPLANGAAQSGGFVEHALVVLLVPPVAILLGCAIWAVAWRVRIKACTRVDIKNFMNKSIDVLDDRAP
jgi:hypothetical protein